MTRIIYVPIEPLTERYTEQWYRRFPILFKEAGFEVLVIHGVPLIDDDIKVGAFLDINSTVHYKTSQIGNISYMFHRGLVKNGDIFFFGDIEFWGLESVRLMAQMNNVDVKITGFLHAASYTREDAFSVAASYQKYTEVGWLAALDRVFVGSRYHKAQVENLRVWDIADDSCQAFDIASKIVVTKNPVFVDEYPKFDGVVKQKKMLLTNRLDPEKRPGETLRLFRDLKYARPSPDWEFVVTTGRKTLRGPDAALAYELKDQGVITIKAGITKEEYHRELAEASIVVSHSIEENYGYCIAEAIHYGCLPFLRKGLSHEEFVNNGYLLFSSRINDDYNKAVALMNAWGTPDWPTCPDLDTNGAQRIVEEIAMLC